MLVIEHQLSQSYCWKRSIFETFWNHQPVYVFLSNWLSQIGFSLKWKYRSMRLAGHAISTCVPKLLVYPPVSSGVIKHGTGKSPINGGGLSIGLVGLFFGKCPLLYEIPRVVPLWLDFRLACGMSSLAGFVWKWMLYPQMSILTEIMGISIFWHSFFNGNYGWYTRKWMILSCGLET